jgi:murein DD-endopeptidase MepM/ murein hydrolase activator NlpD
LKVKLGDHVNAGQSLALLGNSGTSDAPHLPFQLTDGNSPASSEGIPYEFEKFTQLGILGDEEAVLDHGQSWQPKPREDSVAHRAEFPINQ